MDDNKPLLDRDQPTRNLTSGDRSAVEIKQTFTFRYFVVATLAALIPAGIGGLIGYGFNEIVKDRKTIEVSSSSSGNLASVPDNMAANLEIRFTVSSTQREPVKSLFRYEVAVANKSSEGVDNLDIFFTAPMGVRLAEKPEITTEPAALITAILIKPKDPLTSPSSYQISVLNPAQIVKFSFFGYSSQEVIKSDSGLSVIVVKKDWTQKNVDKSALEQKKEINLFNKKVSEFTGFDVALLGAVLGILLVFMSWYPRFIGNLYFRRFDNRWRNRYGPRFE